MYKLILILFFTALMFGCSKEDAGDAAEHAGDEASEAAEHAGDEARKSS